MGSCQWMEWEEGEISSGDEDEEEGINGVYKVNWAKDLSGSRDGGGDFTGGETGMRTEEDGGRVVAKHELKKSARRMASLEGDLKEREERIEDLEERLKQSRARRKGKVDHWTGKSLKLQKVLNESLEVIQILKEELEQKNQGAGTSSRGQQPEVEVPGVSLEGGDFDQEGSAGTAVDLPPSDGNGENRSVPENDEDLELILPSTSSSVRINLSPGGSPPLEQDSSSAEALTPTVEEEPAARQRHGSSADDSVQVQSGPKNTAATYSPSLPFQEPPQHAVDDSFGGKGRKSSRCVCGAHFLTRAQLQGHVRIHTINKHFACRRCGKKYYCAGELRRHLKSAHNIIWKGINGCRDCGSTFETKQLLFVHMKNVHNNGPMVQKYYAATKRAVQTAPRNSRKMKESTRTSAGIAIEDNLETEANDIEAPAEAETEETEVVNRELQSSGHGFKFSRKNTWWCLCGKKYSCERSLKRHVDAKNGLTISRCEYCSKTFSRPDLLKDHLKVHRIKTRSLSKYRQQRNKRMRLN